MTKRLPQLEASVDIADADLLLQSDVSNDDDRKLTFSEAKEYFSGDRTIYVGSVAELEALSLADGTYVDVHSFWDGFDFGGGSFQWQASKDKTLHDGATVIDPDKIGQLVSPGSFGTYFTAAASGTGCYVRSADLSLGLKASWFGAVDDSGVTDNYTALQAAYDSAAGASGVRYVLWDGRYGFGTTLSIAGSIATKGNPADALGGSGLSACCQIWTGGAFPMIEINDSRVRFFDLGVFNDGTATDWISLGPGAILPYWDNINFNLPDVANRFSRSVIYSYGQRLGYGKMKRISTGGSIAPKFIWLDGQTDTFTNRVTTFSIEDSVIAAASGLEMTLFYVRNQGIETLNVKNNSFNTNSSDANLVLVDTTDNPVTDVIFNLNFEGNEIDHIGTDPALRKFKLTNVRGVNFNHNEASVGGQMLHLGDLVNSNVTSYEGNSIRSLAGEVWNADDDSTVVSGVNYWGTSGTPQQTVNNVVSVTRRFQQNDTSVLILDLSKVNASGHTIREIDVNVAGAFSIRALVDQAPIGMVLTVVVRNISGGAISAPSFFPSHFTLGAASVAPADGFSRAFTFYHNGVKFIEMHRGADDVSNA